ncbi:hypothetical protein [Pantoea sp. PNT03]|uniref:hypothetical protein n=1 Tax=Pantoea sp. PNT03 TaxID=2769258 RepID=UPI001784F198|nr:hypothetical protein [Pantoea sp. PNT03]MBD9660962.1 hypothetical protein [Pantoea sp. PNT03]
MLEDLTNKVGSEFRSERFNKVKKTSSAVIPFLIMHFIYFPFLSFSFIYNYMARNGFFSYELISENFFVVSLTSGLTFLMLAGFSVILWSGLGYFILKRNDAISYVHSLWFLFSISVLFQILFLGYMLFSESRMMSVSIYLSSLVLCIFYCCYFTSELKGKIFLIAGLTVVTVYFHMVLGDYSSQIFGKSLKIFGIGGGSNVSLVFKDKNYDRKIGRLTLLTPDFVYLNTSLGSEIIPMNNLRQIIKPQVIKY